MAAHDWDFVVFVGLVLSGAAWLWLHVALIVRVARTRTLPRLWRFGAWFPPLTPFAGFHAGALWLTGLWCVSGGVYLVLRTAL